MMQSGHDQRTMTRRTRFTRHVSIVVTLGCAALATVATPTQDIGRIVIEEEPAGPDGDSFVESINLVMPDMQRLRTPDYDADDQPVIRTTLRLSEPQDAAVARLISDYLERFEAMIREHLADVPRTSGLFNMSIGGPGAREMAKPDDAKNPAEPEQPEPNVNELIGEALGDLAGGEPRGYGLMLMINDDGEAGPDGTAQPGVSIAVDTGDGEPMSEDTRAKLSDAAKKIAETIRKQTEEDGVAPSFVVEGPDPATIEQHRAHITAMQVAAANIKRHKALLKTDLEIAIQELLAEEQMARWPALQRVLLRVKTLPRGRLSGERVDVVALVDALDLTDEQREALDEVLLAYELALDEALRRRNAFLDGAQPKIDECLGNRDFETAMDLADRAARRRIAVRDLNMNYGEQVASMLQDDGLRDMMRAKFREASFPRIARPTYADRAFDAALEIPALDENRRETITTMYDVYRQEREQLNEALTRAIMASEPSEPRRSIEDIASMRNGGPISFGGEDDTGDPVRALRQRARDLDERHVALLRSLLAPDELAQLPAPPARRSGPIIFSADGRQIEGMTLEFVGTPNDR